MTMAARITRRTLLRRGIAGAALLGLGGGAGLALWPGRDLPAPEGLVGLRPARYPVALALAEALLPASGPGPSAAETTLALGQVFARLHPGDQADLNDALGLLESALAGALLDLRPAPFSRLPLPARRAAFGAWGESRLTLRRSAHAALRKLVYGTYYGHPSSYERLGYPGPPDLSAIQEALP